MTEKPALEKVNLKTNKKLWQKFWFQINHNWSSGLIVSLVSLPLGIALSIASGAGPVPGVITGVWAGLVAAIFGGSKFNIVGAAGALSTILYTFANFEGQELVFALPLLAIISGLITLLIWAFRLDKYLIYIPSSVMYGFAAGVAILIAFGQLNDALGLTGVKSETHFIPKIAASFEQIHTWQPNSLFIFSLSLIALIYLKKIQFKIPGAILVSSLGIAFGWLTSFLNSGLKPITLIDKFGQIQATIWNFPDFARLLNIIQQDGGFASRLFSTAVVVSAVSILETLISARLADKITKTKTMVSKEVFGLALANIASGLFGGLPATGVFIRTGLNVKSGASSQYSAGLAAIFTAILAIIFLPLFQYIPMAVISAILLNTAIGLIEIEKFERFWKKETNSLVVSLLVATITIVEDAAIGILLGVVVSLLFFVDKLSRGEFEITFNCNKKVVEFEHGHLLNLPKCQVDIVVYSIEGVMVYLDTQAHQENMQKINSINGLEAVILRLRDLFYIDIDGLDTLEEIITDFRALGKEILITSAGKDVEAVLKQNNFFQEMYAEGKIFDKTKDALFYLGFSDEDLGRHRRKSKLSRT
jgi:SulP family sulfate permease